MVEIDIKVEGYDEAVIKLRQAPRILRRHLRRAMDKIVKTLVAVVQRYPPARPESAYRRTGTLGRRWATEVTSYVGGVQGILDNPTPYGPYVQGEDQAWMHKDRWTTVPQAAEKKKRQVAGALQEGIDGAVKEMEAGA
jgi:hypothetical protein